MSGHTVGIDKSHARTFLGFGYDPWTNWFFPNFNFRFRCFTWVPCFNWSCNSSTNSERSDNDSCRLVVVTIPLGILVKFFNSLSVPITGNEWSDCWKLTRCSNSELEALRDLLTQKLKTHSWCCSLKCIKCLRNTAQGRQLGRRAEQPNPNSLQKPWSTSDLGKMQQTEE